MKATEASSIVRVDTAALEHYLAAAVRLDDEDVTVGEGDGSFGELETRTDLAHGGSVTPGSSGRSVRIFRCVA